MYGDEVVIYGVNHMDHGSGVPDMSEGRDIGLLQDTSDVDAWGAWQAEWRDVFVVDRNGEVVDVFNLTDNSLEDPNNADTLRAMFDQAIGG